MEEERAAAYYEEMRRRGGGAAKLKQGLGYSSSSSLSAAEAPSSKPSFLNFVKGDSHADSLAKQQKENRLAAVRDKLKRGPVDSNDIEDDAGNRCHKSSDHDRSRERDPPYKGERSFDGRRIDHDFSGHTVDHLSDRERTLNDHHSRDERHVSKSEKTRSFRTEHEARSQNSLDSDQRRCNHRHSKNSRSVPCCRKSPSRSRSPERRLRYANGKEERERERIRSSSREQYLVSGKHGTCKSGSGIVGSRSLKKQSICDYSKLIPGFDNMTPAEKVKAKMKFQLSETASKDTAKGIGNDWERFTFCKAAPLDDDAKLDYFGDGTGSSDDTRFLQHTGSTFLSTSSQAKREAQIQAAHDAAIFGPSAGMSHEKMGSHGLLIEESTMDSDPSVQIDRAPAMKDLLSEQVLHLQQGSWRERALKLKEQGGASSTGSM